MRFVVPSGADKDQRGPDQRGQRCLVDYVLFGHAFAVNHDGLVGTLRDDIGLPHILVDVPTMVPVKVSSGVQEGMNLIVNTMNRVFSTQFSIPSEHSH